ncbi:MAG: DDE-type integrase/transposase/recombinase [Candidatus Helarchaeota archaeon]
MIADLDTVADFVINGTSCGANRTPEIETTNPNIIDIYSRKIVGYTIGKTLSSELAIAALNIAIATRDTEELIHHSDQGI